ncbi:MAG: penicillin-binding protein 1C [Flavobacteriales bacterium]|nr:penicillin-binding protein 1C [Flavobacteriales bacterium]
MIRRHKKYYYISLFIGMMTWYYLCLPSPLFVDPISTVLEDRNGNLLGARIAKDEQWRFPLNNNVPEKFKTAIIQFEDKRFYSHPGFDPLAFGRAMVLNIKQRRVVSGGSTLSMQVIRLSRKGQSRSYFEKIIELILATRLEITYSKEEILALYAAYAPFGGNVVGLDAAAWKYFGREVDQLSWSESAILAVLPNAPSLIHPGKNRDLLKAKRDRLLAKLYDKDLIDSLTYVLAKEEILPEKPHRLPSYASHLLERVKREARGVNKGRVSSTLDINVQNHVSKIASRHHYRLSQNGIENLAAVVVDVKTNQVVAYIGNTPFGKSSTGAAVDIVTARRSSGSILKPFLYAASLSEGELLPHSLIPDVPSFYSGYSPKNFDQKYSGAVPANEALYKSLNVPAVKMLAQFGVLRFHSVLNNIGLTTIDRPASDYGLSLILGGAETSLWDLAGTYAGMARVLNNFGNNSGKYEVNNYAPLTYVQPEAKVDAELTLVNEGELSAGAIWHTFEAMVEVKRPGTEHYWKDFSSKGKIAWKTGTSFGFRDAWAVGVTPDYVVAVWCGNADGEGRPELIGVQAAAPFMFDIFDYLSKNNFWFDPPYDEMTEIIVCKESGFKAKEICENKDTILIYQAGNKTKPCPYHEIANLDESEKWRVNSECVSPINMVKKSYFVLPPVMEWYYKTHHPSYATLPDYKEECLANSESGKSNRSMQLIYPRTNTRIAIPTNLDESKSRAVFEVSHRNPETIIYWHLDDTYLGQTKRFHEQAVNPPIGKHLLTLVDEHGEVLQRSFEIY